MAAGRAPVRVVERTSKCLRLREDARVAAAASYLTLGLFFLALPLLVPSHMAANAARLWTIPLVALPLGLNRLLGTISTFDLHAGTVSVSRVLGRLVIFRRVFEMDDVVRVFHDRREYVRIKIQNPRLELRCGKRVNLSQWCSRKLDLETEVAAANRLLYCWKKARSEARGETIELFSRMYAQSCPRDWTLEGLRGLGRGDKARGLLWLRRSGTGLLIGVAVAVLTGYSLPGSVRMIVGVATAACLCATLICSGLLLIDWLETKR
jgi:hypothetical protein